MPPESRYTFAEYDPDWPAAFERESARLRTLLADELVEIHHFGSTSVPGLAAKPIIDILPLVRRLAAVDERTPQLQASGYRPWGEYGLPGRRFFTRDHEGFRSHNIHIYETGSPGVERHLAFSAYLRHDESARREYEALKREVYARHPTDIVAYNNAKDALIKRLEAVAVDWWRRGDR